MGHKMFALALVATYAVMAQAEKGEVILITGASSGIGRATAKVMAAAGYRVIAMARGEAKLKTLVEEIEADGGVAAYIQQDVLNDCKDGHICTDAFSTSTFVYLRSYPQPLTLAAADTPKALAFGDDKFGGIDHFFLVCK